MVSLHYMILISSISSDAFAYYLGDNCIFIWGDIFVGYSVGNFEHSAILLTCIK